MKKTVCFVLLFIALLAVNGFAASSVTLTWDSSPDQDVAGYNIYRGTASRTYTTKVDAGNVTTYTLPNLPDGKYFIAATAYDKDGLESDYSNELVLTLDSKPPAAPKNLKAVSVKVTVELATGNITSTTTTGTR